MKIISACLVGIKCRYNGKSKLNRECLRLFKRGGLIPVCPEQLGGFPTPREPAEIKKSGKIFTKSGKNVTKNFLRGAKETLKIAKTLGIKEAILKARSPSCGSGFIYDGSFSNKLIKGDGATAFLLRRNGIKVITEEDL